MLGYAVKLTRAPAVVEIADVPALCDANFTGRVISDIIQVVAYLALPPAWRIARAWRWRTIDREK